MHRSLPFVPALLLGVLIGCRDQGLSPAASRAGPSFATASAQACPANPTVIVTDEAGLRAALAAAHPGDVIAVSGTIELTTGDTIATDGVTLTCATPGSGLVATDLSVLDVVTVTARGVTVDGLLLDGSRAGDSPFFVLNDGVNFFAQDVRFTHNSVTCTVFGSCVSIVGGTGAVVSDNSFQATDAFTGIHLQANGPDPNVVFPIRIDGARIERNSSVALTPSQGPRFGAIRPFDADNLVIADNVITGPWRNGISPARLTHSQIQRNQISGPVVDGIRTSSFGGALRGVAQNVFTSNQVSGAGRAGIFADRACSNRLASNDLRGNAGDWGCSSPTPRAPTSSRACRTPWSSTTGRSTATATAASTPTSSPVASASSNRRLPTRAVQRRRGRVIATRSQSEARCASGPGHPRAALRARDSTVRPGVAKLGSWRASS